MPRTLAKARSSPFARPVATVMAPVKLTLSPHHEVGHAIDVFLAAGRRHLVVVDDDGRCVGLLSDRDVMAAWPMSVTWVRQRLVSGLIRRRTPVIGPEVTVAQAARLMAAYGVDALPVVNKDRRPLGIVTDTDIITLVALAA